MFPIGDDQVKGGYKAVFTWAIVAINIVVFLYQISLGPAAQEQFIYQYATIPNDIIHGEHRITLLTSMFLHGGWMHIIGNMLFLGVFGDNIEARIGNFKFLSFYLISGLVGSLAHILTGPGSMIPSLGASGAISGVLGAYLVMFPGSRIKMLFLNTMSTQLWPASQFLIYWIGIQFVSGFGSLAAAGEGGGGVAYFAHIGGFAAGWIWGMMNRRKKSALQQPDMPLS